MASSCSFRITRTAEDLAQTINALSQRLVKLEQRQEAMELQLTKSSNEPPIEEIKMLDGVDQLLRECKELLDSSANFNESQEELFEEEEHDALVA